jgi:hypothetical protein
MPNPNVPYLFYFKVNLALVQLPYLYLLGMKQGAQTKNANL